MAEERSEGATTEGPSVTSTVDTNARLPRLATPSESCRRWWCRRGLELATSLGDSGASAAPYVSGTLFAVRSVTRFVGLKRGPDSILDSPNPEDGIGTSD